MATSSSRKSSNNSEKNNLTASNANGMINMNDESEGERAEKWRKKRKINYYLSKEDIQYLVQNTRYNEQELR